VAGFARPSPAQNEGMPPHANCPSKHKARREIAVDGLCSAMEKFGLLSTSCCS
jgi:hypothetical protein